MPCHQVSSGNNALGSRPTYATEAQCLERCKEGACCQTVNGVTTCSVKPQCQCQGAGKTFKGVGTTCESTNGACCRGNSCSVKPQCECQGSGNTFKGVGTTCSPNPCVCYCPDGRTLVPDTLVFTLSGGVGVKLPQPCLGNVTVEESDLHALDWYFPQLAGTYAFQKVNCDPRWEWHGDSGGTAAISTNGGFGQEYYDFESFLVPIILPNGTSCLTELNSSCGGGLGRRITFLNDMCSGGSRQSCGALWCQQFVQGTNVAPYQPSIAIHGRCSYPHSDYVLYVMDFTLSPA